MTNAQVVKACQARYVRAGKCRVCGRVRLVGSRLFCWPHLLQNRLRVRRDRGSRPWRLGGRGRPPLITEQVILGALKKIVS